MRAGISSLVLVGVALLAVGTIARGAPQGHAAESLTLESVKVDKSHLNIAEAWSIPDGGGTVTWSPYFGKATYTFSLPQTIPTSGATVNLSLQVQATAPNRFAPGMAILGDIVKEGRTDLNVLAEAGESKSVSKAVTLVPGSSSPTVVTVGIQDGPTFTYTYTSAAGGTGCKKDRRLSGGAAINEVRVVAVTPDVAYHPEGSPDECWLPVEMGTVLKQGDEISVDPDGSATLAFADNSTVVLTDITQLKIASFFTEGGVVRTEILLKMGKVAAKVNKSEATKSDFRIKQPTATASVRGTRFSVFYDPGSKASITSVTEGVVTVDPTKPGVPTVELPAGKEIEVTATSASPVAPVGKAGARGGVNRFGALARVMKVIARFDDPCKLITPRLGATSIKPSAGGWLVSVRLLGKNGGWSTWRVIGPKITSANALAKRVAAGCR